jgi:hypothetical protein
MTSRTVLFKYYDSTNAVKRVGSNTEPSICIYYQLQRWMIPSQACFSAQKKGMVPAHKHNFVFNIHKVLTVAVGDPEGVSSDNP